VKHIFISRLLIRLIHISWRACSHWLSLERKGNGRGGGGGVLRARGYVLFLTFLKEEVHELAIPPYQICLPKSRCLEIRRRYHV